MANNLVVQLLLKTGTFSNDLKTARGQVQNFQKGCQNASDAMDAFGKSLGVDIGSLTKFAPAAAAAAAAGKILKDSFKNNTDAMDNFNREAEVVKATYRSLTTQLFKNGSMTMDFKGIATQAREYYDAIDQAGVAQVAITNELKLQQVEYDQLYATAMDVSLSEVNRLEALNEASNVLEHQLTLKRQMAQFDRQAAKEGLENGLVSSGINKYWLETEGQNMLKELLQFDSSNGQYMFDTFFGSVNPNSARNGVFNTGIYARTIEKMKTREGAKAVEREALEKGYNNVTEYLDALRKEEEQATEVINSTKYQLAQALHNMRGSTQGFEQISKYILLVLNDFGLQQIDAEAKQTRALIERLRKRITGRDGSTKTYEEGSIGYLESELTKYNEDLKSALDQNTRDIVLDKIAATQATIDAMRGKNKGTELTKGSQSWLSSEIEKIDTEISNLDLGLPESQPLLQKMNDWENSWEEFVNSLTEEERKLFDQFEKNMKKRWDLMNIKLGYSAALSSAQGNKTPGTTPAKTEDKEYLEGSYGYKKAELNKRIDKIRTTLTEGVNLSDEDIKKKIAELKALEQELSDLEEKFGFKTVIKQGTNAWDEFNSAMADTSTIVNSLTNTFKENSEVTAASILQMVSTTLPAIGSLISAISALTAAEAVEAGVAATGKAVSTSKHWIEAISAVAALGAVVAAAISAANKPSIQRFANGGIVGGSSFTGDRVSAQVNSGEMILNKSQQANLFRIANGGGTGKEVTFRISGTDLVGVMNNINRKNKMIR